MADDDKVYYPFKSKWLGKWHDARYMCTLADLKERFPEGDYIITGPGVKRFNPYGPDGEMYAPWGHGMVWEQSVEGARGGSDDEGK